MDSFLEFIRTVGLFIFISMVVSTVVAIFLLAISVKKLRNLEIPPGATFAETLHYTPFFLVLGIDLLDLGLDILAAPLSWVILDRLGLKALRGMASVEALIPGTQLLPTLTLCWIGVRLFGPDYKDQISRALKIQRIAQELN